MTKITYLCITVCLIAQTFSFADNMVSENFEESNMLKPQRVRINCTTPSGHIRHLLLAFTPDNIATDGYDSGYDAYTYDYIPNDLNWMIDDSRFVIQGVGAFEKSKQYPLGMFLTNSGTMEIRLTELENFENPVEVFIYDAELDTYTKINDNKFSKDMTNGEYTDRFFIAFENKSTSNKLSTENNNIEAATINYLSNSKELYVNTVSNTNIKSVTVFSILGQKLFAIENIYQRQFRLNADYIKTNYAIVKVETEQGFSTKKILIH